MRVGAVAVAGWGVPVTETRLSKSSNPAANASVPCLCRALWDRSNEFNPSPNLEAIDSACHVRAGIDRAMCTHTEARGFLTRRNRARDKRYEDRKRKTRNARRGRLARPWHVPSKEKREGLYELVWFGLVRVLLVWFGLVCWVCLDRFWMHRASDRTDGSAID